MKAIIMAGGEGSRLRPLTCDCPKPMVPLMDKPVMAYALELVKRHRIREAAATLHYLPDRVRDYFSDGSAFGLALRYYVEDKPLGTAGSVRQAADFLTETFVVLSGDGVTDCDLTRALAFHRERSALATMVVKRVEYPLEYGLVVSDESGRVVRFVEKPGWGEVCSDTVNTGIYILEPEALKFIPADRPWDFGRDLFPAMVEKGLPVYAWPMEGYWCDIGDISAYLKAHADALEGRIGLETPGKTGGVCRMPGARVDAGAILEGPCYIGPDAVVREGARVGPYSVLGAGSEVSAHASVKRAVLWEGARLMPGAQARGCALLKGSVMGEGSSAFEESVLGGGAELGARSVLLPGVKVWPGKKAPEGARLDANLVWGGGERPCFLGGRLPLTDPAQAARAAQAYASAVRPKNALLIRASSSVALSCALAVQSGLMAQGIQVLDGGTGSLPQLRVMIHALHADGGLFVDGEGFRALDRRGAELETGLQRKVEQLLLRQDYPRSFATITKLPSPAGRADLIYTGAMLEAADLSSLAAARPRLAVYAPNEQLLTSAECVLEKAGCAVRAEWEEELMELEDGEIGVWLTEGGESMRLTDEDGSLSEGENALMRAWALLESGEKEIVLPVSATRAVEALAVEYGARVRRVKGERAFLTRALAGAGRRQLMTQFDGLYAAVQCVGHLCRLGMTLTQWKSAMPRLHRASRTVPVDWKDKGMVLGALINGEKAPDMTDGLCVRRDGGWAWIAPDSQKAECRVVAEAVDAETARELCDFYAGRIARALQSERGAEGGQK